MNENILAGIGLSTNEAKAYLALLEIGTATGGQVAERSKVHRTNVYDALDRLVKKGLISYFTKEKTRYFEATDPGNLLNLLKSKERELQQIMPELALSRQMAHVKSGAAIFEGINAFMDILYEFLDFNESILVYGIPQIAPQMLRTKIPHFHKERIKRKIPMKHIYNHNAKARIRYLNTLPYVEAKYLPARFDSQVSTNICGDEVVLVLWSNPPLTIKIKNVRIADSYKKYFELLWKAAKR